MEPLKEQRWRPRGQSGSKLRALQTLPRGSGAPSNIEPPTGTATSFMREAFGVREACFRFAMKPVKLSNEPYVRGGSSPPKSEMLPVRFSLKHPTCERPKVRICSSFLGAPIAQLDRASDYGSDGL